MAIFAVGELVEGLLTVAPPAGVACGVGVVAAVVFVGVAALATPPREVEEAARLEAEPPRLVADEGLSFVHISAKHCDHGSECCRNKRMTLDSAPPVLLFKDFYRNGRNTQFWLVALRGKVFGIKTLTIAHQTQSIFIKL